MAGLEAQQTAFHRAVASQPVVRRASQQEHASERPRSKPPAQRVLPSNGRGSVLAQSITVLDALKAAKRALTSREIYDSTKIYLLHNPQLETALRTDPHVVWLAEQATYAWKAELQMHSKEELLEFIRERSHEGGVEVNKLKESYPDVVQAAKDLAKDKLIFILVNAKDQSPRFLFHNPCPPALAGDYGLDNEIKSIWETLQVPDDTDLRKQLEAAGMKEQKTFEQKGDRGKVKQKKPAKRRVKITNTHLAGTGIDLLNAYIKPTS